ncbi:hypothetical protein KJ891_00620, partial [Candidatus Micrarchaeota archaeon]|nr:hypothetical protein [Candidatus Micrarchaeota archaeon]
MRTAICESDLKREFLCTECGRKLAEKEISELDVRVSRLLHKLSKRFFEPDIEFKKALELENLIVLVCTGNIGSAIGRRGVIVAEMSRELGKKVRIIEKAKDEKKMIGDLVGAVRLLGVNKIFRPEGLGFTVKIAKGDEGRMVTNAASLEKA